MMFSRGFDSKREKFSIINLSVIIINVVRIQQEIYSSSPIYDVKKFK